MAVFQTFFLLGVLAILSVTSGLAQQIRPAAVVPSTSSIPTVWVTDSLSKVQPNSPAGVGQSISLSAARNEFESFQVHVQAGTTPVQLNLTVGDFVNTQTGEILASGKNVAIFREAYVNVTTPSDLNGITGQVPDPLIPVQDAYFHEPRNAFPTTVPPNEIRSAWVDVFVPPGTTSGPYVASVTVQDGTNTIATIQAQLKVWNFTLPSTATLKSSFGMTFGSLDLAGYGTYTSNYPGAGGDVNVAFDLIRTAVGKFFLDHRISVLGLTTYQRYPLGQWSQFDATYGTLLDGTAPTILQGARLTTMNYSNFAPPTVNSADLQDWTTHFGQKGWLPALFTYMCDEPPYGCAWGDVATRGSSLHAAAPNVPTLVTTTIANATQNGVLNSIDILTPPVSLMHPMGMNSQRPSYDGWLTGAGKQLWWYQACDAHASCDNGIPGPTTSTWPSYMIDASPMRNRVFQWMAYLYRTQGEVYYNVENWGDNPWDHLYSAGGNGDGALYYPGSVAQIGGSTVVPVASVRLKHIRDGMEDYEYLYALSHAGYDALAQSATQSFITNLYTFSGDPQQLRAARETLGTQLHQLSLQPPPFSITSLSPASFVAQGAGTTLTVQGVNFAPGDSVRWSSPSSGSEIGLPTTFVSSTQLTATVGGSLLTSAGTVKLAVQRNPVQAARTSMLILPNVPTTLGVGIGGKAGASNARVWTIQFTDNGPGIASGVQISNLSLAQTAGTTCTPIVQPLPPAIASIAPGATATAPVTIDFSSCTGTVRFRVSMPFTANGGSVSGILTSNNQVP